MAPAPSYAAPKEPVAPPPRSNVRLTSSTMSFLVAPPNERSGPGTSRSGGGPLILGTRREGGIGQRLGDATDRTGGSSTTQTRHELRRPPPGVRATDEALLRESVKSSMHAQRVALQWQEKLVDGAVSRDTLKKATRHIQRSQWIEILSERHVSSQCAYPCCANPPSRPYSDSPSAASPAMRISRRTRSVVRNTASDPGGRDGFCSDECMRKAKWVEGWVLAAMEGEGPIWARVGGEESWRAVELWEDVQEQRQQEQGQAYRDEVEDGGVTSTPGLSEVAPAPGSTGISAKMPSAPPDNVHQERLPPRPSSSSTAPPSSLPHLKRTHPALTDPSLSNPEELALAKKQSLQDATTAMLASLVIHEKTPAGTPQAPRLGESVSEASASSQRFSSSLRRQRQLESGGRRQPAASPTSSAASPASKAKQRSSPSSSSSPSSTKSVLASARASRRAATASISAMLSGADDEDHDERSGVGTDEEGEEETGFSSAGLSRAVLRSQHTPEVALLRARGSIAGAGSLGAGRRKAVEGGGSDEEGSGEREEITEDERRNEREESEESEEDEETKAIMEEALKAREEARRAGQLS